MSQKKNKLPIIIMLCPTNGVLPEGFPIKADNVYDEHEVLKKVARLDEIRLDKESAGVTEPPVEMWMISVIPLRFAREIAKHIEDIQFKVVLDVPEADYSSPWSMIISDLATYSVDQLKPHVDPEDPNKQVESNLTEESQVKQMEKTMANLEDILESANHSDDISTLGSEGVDDTI
jgi:hypothetical protein